MRARLAALLLLVGSLEAHAGGGAHHLAGEPGRLIAAAAEHPASASHLEASGSVLERGCPICAALGRGLAILATPVRQSTARQRFTAPRAPTTELAAEPLLLPAPPRGPPAR